MAIDESKDSSSYGDSEQDRFCPECGELGKFVPPTEIARERRIVRVTFKCPSNHLWVFEKDLK